MLPAMSTLKDQLLKLGMVSEQQARRVTHDQRVQQKGQGPAAVQAQRENRREDTEQARQARRDEDRQREKARQAEADAKAASHRVADIVESGKVDGRTGGNRRFYYEARDGRVPCLELSDDAFDALTGGRGAVAESPRGEVTLITGDAARRVAELDASWLRAWNGRATG